MDARRGARFVEVEANRTSGRMVTRFLATLGRDWSSAEARLRLATYALGAAALVIYVVNNILGSIRFDANSWIFPAPIPAQAPPGSDFYAGVYEPSALLRQGQSPYAMGNAAYPPFMALFGLPFTLFSFKTAYLIQFGLLILANVAVLGLSVKLAVLAFHPLAASESSRNFASTLMLLMAFVHLTGYGFIFSLERGNYDIFPILLSLVALWLIVRRPRWLWLPTALLSLAVHMKLYPAILFILTLRRHRWRALLPAFVCNVALLFALGWKWLPDFVGLLKVATTFDHYMSINHSVNSFVATVLVPDWEIPLELRLRLAVVPALLWAAGAIVLWRRRPFSAQNAVLLYALSIPAMEVIPNVSYDYKLVMSTVPLTMLLYGCVMRFATDGSKLAALTACILLALTGNISRSYIMTPHPWLSSKCPSIMVMQLLVLAAVLIPGVVSPPANPRGRNALGEATNTEAP